MAAQAGAGGMDATRNCSWFGPLVLQLHYKCSQVSKRGLVSEVWSRVSFWRAYLKSCIGRPWGLVQKICALACIAGFRAPLRWRVQQLQAGLDRQAPASILLHIFALPGTQILFQQLLACHDLHATMHWLCNIIGGQMESQK